MLNKIWDQFLLIAQEEAGSRVVETWLKAVSLHSWDAVHHVLYVTSPNAFIKEWVKSNYLHLFHLHLNRLLNVNHLKIIFIEDQEKATSVEVASIKVMPAQRLVLPTKKKDAKLIQTHQVHLNKNFLFDAFIIGPHNHMAYAAAHAITQKLGKLYNPLFIYGDSGLGKTHLLHAIAHEVKKNYDQVEVLYQPADRFVSEFIHAIRFDKIHQFQAKYKSIDVLLIDDVQCISSKEQTQEAFFHIFNTLYDAHKQIVFSGDSYPANMEGIAERLRSRMVCGLVVDVQAPSIETKIAILKRKAELHDVELSDEVALHIASCVNSNIRELEGAFIRVNAFAQLTKKEISLDLVKSVLIPIAPKPQAKHHIDFERILKTVVQFYPYTLTDLRSKKRSKELCLARQIVMYFMRELTSRSLNEIAIYLGRTDHTTVIHAFKQMQLRLSSNQTLSSQLHRMKEEILS